MKDADVVVVGGGLAGTVAALSAASTSDRSVALVTEDETTLSRASGIIDVLGYTPSGKGPVADPFEQIPDLPPEHPYSVVGVEAVREGLSLFDDVTGEAYRGGHTDRNALVPTQYGRVKPTARYPSSVAPGLASETRPTSLVGFRRLTGFDAALASGRLIDQVPYDVRDYTIRFPVEAVEPTDTETLPLAFARALDENPDTEAGHSVRESLVRRINLYRNVEERIGLPAILGLEALGPVREYLEEAFGVKVFEIPMGPPSVPGYRLQAHLDDALEAADVNVQTGWTVTDFEDDGERIDSLTLENEFDAATPEQYQGTEFLLANGGILGGGIATDREAVTESVFGCQVDVPSNRYDWADAEALDSHPFASFGVSINESMRPQTDSGEPEFANLRAAGSVVGGYDFAAEKSGSGVSIATGYVAGRRAAESV